MGLGDNMQRYFTNNKVDDNLVLSDSDSYHILRVMRMNLNGRIEIVYNNDLYICEIVDTNPTVIARIISKEDNKNELSFDITIVQSLVKEQKMDYILQKITELGASRIIPYEASRSVIKLDNRKDKKIERWQKIIKEATEQSKRTSIPIIENVISLFDLARLSDYDMKFLCTVNEKSQNLKKVLSNLDGSVKMIFVIGPEGGFTDIEEKELIDNDFIPVSLGDSVLRTETASTFIMSVIRYIDMG